MGGAAAGHAGGQQACDRLLAHSSRPPRENHAQQADSTDVVGGVRGDLVAVVKHLLGQLAVCGAVRRRHSCFNGRRKLPHKSIGGQPLHSAHGVALV